jgi:hypothetical protein
MSNEIIIVSWLPRSGTSLMMKMLEKGGMPIVTDRIRKADIDNHTINTSLYRNWSC